ncbi:MAG: outer membrane beta-barrel protein [Armatimonadota bacterium]
MAKNWLISALAAAAFTAAPALAEEPSPVAPPPPAPEGTQVAQAGEPAPAPAGGEEGVRGVEEEPTPKYTYGGSVDFYYSSNFNNPDPPFNALAPFDIKDEHGPHLGLLDVWLQKQRDPFGFRVDLMFGPTGRLTNFAESASLGGVSGDDLWDHVQQAFLSFNLNDSGSTYVDVGRWVTPIGAELIEPKDNWLYSRSILFGFAIPYTHTGLRVYHYLNDTDYVMGHVTQGWDRVSGGSGPGFGLTYAKTLNEKWSGSVNYLGSDEPGPRGSDSFRNLIDVVALYNPGGRWSYIFNFDYGTQPGADWYGLAALAKYTINEKSYAAVRGEFMVDSDGFRFGTGTSTVAYGVTFNYTYQFTDNFQTRLEYRHDFSDENLFLKERGRTTDNQGRFILSAILSYN